ncbi:hypothetical protein [Streptomyces marianii]|uniref:Uncharacterized protein n=1 Tax=Streptomyces marianii TaxID=1817406 RepID=A0A5R9DRH7_9ACTN|nr:hypothetical protein [Streptomyces marianii]TLQ39187.1 hypothetical protein FEF34_37945 [Streptomyces marianii]
MAEDTDHTPEPARSGGDDLAALAAPRRRTVDEHMFTAPGLPGTFRLQLFTAPGARPVAVVTQIAREEGMGLTNGAERFAAAVWERHCPEQDLPPVWVERQLWGEDSLQETRFRRVVFAETDRYRPRQPRWRAITPEQLETLVGGPVETGRGTGYVPRPDEPEPQPVFEAYAVVRLARPKPFRAPACMPAGVPWWRRWTRQLLPNRTVRTCCWYHGGDWHKVNALALEALRRSREQAVDPDDMREFAVSHAAAAGATDWETEALATLFCLGDAIQPDREVRYINGQHRAQAMLDAGVRRTVVLRHIQP